MRPAELASNEEDLSELAADLDALGSRLRLRVLPLLTRGRHAEEVADVLGLTRQGLLRHLAKLEARGFLTRRSGHRPTGPVVEYVVCPPRLFATGVKIGELGRLRPQGGPARHVGAKTDILPGTASRHAPGPGPLRTARIVTASGPLAGAAHELSVDRDRWTVGRDRDRDIAIPHDPFVSGRHAEIHRDDSGLFLVDALSANGTLLNFHRIPRGSRVPLSAGDVVGVGHTVLVVQET